MADITRYVLHKKYAELIDQSLGKPKGTTPVDITPAELIAIGDKLARAITVLQWGVVGVMGMLVSEHGFNRRKDKSMLPYSNFEWQKYISQAQALEYALSLGTDYDLLSPPEVMHKCFTSGRGAEPIPPEESLTIWTMVRGGKYNMAMAHRLMAAARAFHKDAHNRGKLLSKVLADTQELLEGRDDSNDTEREDMAGHDLQGQGPETDPACE